jgi:single-strand DNA-binding protein
MLNRITLIGRLTRDPELKTLSTGKKLVEFSIAVNKRIKPKEGNDADFFYVKTWGQTAEYVNEYIGKGRMVSVDGRMETNQYTKDDKTVTSYFVTADNVTALDRPKDDNREAKPKQSSAKQTSQSDDEYDPFADE